MAKGPAPRRSRSLLLLLLAALAAASPAPACAALRLTGSGDDATSFLQMLRDCTCKEVGLAVDGTTVLLVEELPIEECPTACPSTRELVNQVLASTAVLAIELIRTNPRTLLDAFDGDGRGRVDLDDLDRIELTPPPEDPNLSDRCENIGHFLAEYFCAATNGIAAPAGDVAARTNDYNDCHPRPADERSTFRRRSSSPSPRPGRGAPPSPR